MLGLRDAIGSRSSLWASGTGATRHPFGSGAQPEEGAQRWQDGSPTSRTCISVASTPSWSRDWHGRSRMPGRTWWSPRATLRSGRATPSSPRRGPFSTAFPHPCSRCRAITTCRPSTCSSAFGIPTADTSGSSRPSSSRSGRTRRSASSASSRPGACRAAAHWAMGRIGRRQLTRALDRLAQLPPDLVRIVVVHHPLLLPDAPGRQWSAARIHRRRRASDGGLRRTPRPAGAVRALAPVLLAPPRARSRRTASRRAAGGGRGGDQVAPGAGSHEVPWWCRPPAPPPRGCATSPTHST